MSSQKIIDAMRVHHDFVRVHSSPERTPAEQAGIRMEPVISRIEGLMKMASKPSRGHPIRSTAQDHPNKWQNLGHILDHAWLLLHI